MIEKLSLTWGGTLDVVIDLVSDGPIEDPNAKSWFCITLIDKYHQVMKITTKDGIIYRNATSSAGRVGFTPRQASLIRGAIERYVDRKYGSDKIAAMLKDT